MTAPLPLDEPQRLEDLLRLNVLDAAPDPQLQSIVEIAASVFQAPIALVSLVDSERQVFKARVGLEADQTCRDYAFCAYAILQPEPLVVEDATKDPRFAGNPLVTAAPHIRFYAGAPLTTRRGLSLGTLCVIDTKPRKLTKGQAATLQMLAALAVETIQTRQRLDIAEASALLRKPGPSAEGLQLSALGHELRTPLNHILGFVDLLRSNLAKEDAERHSRNLEYLDIVRQSGSHLAALVERITDLEQAGDEAALKIERIDLKAALGPVVKSFEGSLAAKRQRIDFQAPPVPMIALADVTSLRQIAINLISNASKYAPPETTITLALKRYASEPRCFLVVEDDGPGFPLAVLNHLGEPFVRGEAARRSQQGSGLGLHVTLRLCRALGGDLRIEAREEGGSRVIVRLPAAGEYHGCEPRLVVG